MPSSKTTTAADAVLNQRRSLLGGLRPATFMRRHWQKRPLLVRQAWPGITAPVSRSALFALAASEDVESRLVQRGAGGWKVRHGPLPRTALPPVSRSGWTLLVQGLNLHVPAAHALLAPFRFLPAARLDDLMISWASEGGGVGPHLDSYDVFLLQVQGRRRWRIGRVADDTLVPDQPLKLLRHFEPEHEWVLEPGDMLYLPPRWGHDGDAVDGECMTCSVGFRAPSVGETGRELLMRLAEDDDADDPRSAALYRDPRQPATATPGEVPPALTAFARAAIDRLQADPDALARVLGEWLTEPKPQVWFPAAASLPAWGTAAVRLSARTRMLYDDRHVFINGEALRAGGRDARLMRLLADQGRLAARDLAGLGADATALLQDWLAAGWLEVEA